MSGGSAGEGAAVRLGGRRLALGSVLAGLLLGCAAPPPPIPPPDGDLQVAVLSSDLAVGANRLALALALRGRHGRTLHGGPLHLLLLPPQGEAGRVEAVAPPRPPGGDLTVYVAQAAFARPGAWRVEVQAPSGRPEAPWTGSALVEVHAASATPALGAPAPDLGVPLPAAMPGAVIPVPLSPAGTPAPAAAPTVWSGVTVLTVAAPAWCPAGECAAQLAALAGAARGLPEARFLHLDPFPNATLPAELPGPLRAWNLRTQPWTFVIGGDGRIAAKFEGYTGAAELAEAVQRALAPRG